MPMKSTANLLKNVLLSDKTKIKLFSLMFNVIRCGTLTLCTLSSWLHKVVAESCFGDAFLQQRQISWSELIGRQKWLKTEQY